MVSGIGTDIEEVARFKQVSQHFLKRVFTLKEREYCLKRKESWIHLAGTFCAKEAVVKAYGGNCSLLEVEIGRDVKGKPFAKVKGKVSKKLHISISHTSEYAIAFAVLD